jgi:hypothetical protein
MQGIWASHTPPPAGLERNYSRVAESCRRHSAPDAVANSCNAIAQIHRVIKFQTNHKLTALDLPPRWSLRNI